MHVEGLSDAEIAARVGEQVGERVDRSTIRKARGRVGMQEMIAAARRSRGSTIRSQRQRDREREKREADAIDPAKLAERIVGHPADTESHRRVKVLRRDFDTGAMIDTGTRELVRKHGRWYRTTATCGLVAARRADFEGNPPADFDDAPAFGPPGFPRPALGTYDPVPRVRHVNERGIEVTSPVPVGPELDRALAAGAILV